MEPFEVDVPREVLADLRARLLRTRWPDEVTGAGWDYGANLSYMQELVAYWVDDFDWLAQQRLINEWPQFRAKVGGVEIHFVQAPGQGRRPFPLVLTHGWPSTFFEMHKIIGPLSDPEGHGGDAADAFDVVVPSLPGFGFSERPVRRGFVRVDNLWRELMTGLLGYQRFGAFGTDVGARVTSALGRFHGDVVAGIHLGSVDLEWPEPLPAESELTEREREYVERVRRWEREEGAYAALQATRPQTAAYGLNDSPAGLAAWIVEKFRAWSDCGGEVERRFTKDELLTTITIYWATQTMNSSMRRYFEKRQGGAPAGLRPGERIECPTGVTMFPGERELVVPREFAERVYNVRRWTEPARGGHVAALEEPEVLVEEIRAFFREVRGA